MAPGYLTNFNIIYNRNNYLIPHITDRLFPSNKFINWLFDFMLITLHYYIFFQVFSV